LLVQLAEDVHADYEVDYLDVVDADLAAKDRGDFESVHLRGGRRDALAFCARCQSGEEESVLPFRGIERCLQLLGVRPWSGEGGFQRVKPLEPVMGSEEHITERRCEDGLLSPIPIQPQDSSARVNWSGLKVLMRSTLASNCMYASCG